MYLLRKPKSSRWYVCWRDLQGKPHRWAAFPSKTLSLALGNKVQGVIDHARAGQPLPLELARVARNLEPARQAELLKLGIIDAAMAPNKPLRILSDEYKAHLQNLGRTPEHVRHVDHHVKYIIDTLKAAQLSEVTEPKLVKLLRDLRQSGFGAGTVNYYLRAMKQFAKWSARQLHEENPIGHVKKMDTAQEGATRRRRALTEDECSRLLLATLNGPTRCGHTGQSRYWLYRIALQTGIRRKELRSLTIGDVDLKAGIITVQASFAKAGTTRIAPISKDAADGLRKLWRGRRRTDKAFPMPYLTVQVLRDDLKAARIKPIAGRVMDFHALRHTFCTRVGSRTKVHTAKALMGHQTVQMTMRYMHEDIDDMRQAVDGLG